MPFEGYSGDPGMTLSDSPGLVVQSKGLEIDAVWALQCLGLSISVLWGWCIQSWLATCRASDCLFYFYPKFCIFKGIRNSWQESFESRKRLLLTLVLLWRHQSRGKTELSRSSLKEHCKLLFWALAQNKPLYGGCDRVPGHEHLCHVSFGHLRQSHGSCSHYFRVSKFI